MKKTDLKKLKLETTTLRLLDQINLREVAGGQSYTNDPRCSNGCTSGYSCLRTGLYCCEP